MALQKKTFHLKILELAGVGEHSGDRIQLPTTVLQTIARFTTDLKFLAVNKTLPLCSVFGFLVLFCFLNHSYMSHDVLT